MKDYLYILPFVNENYFKIGVSSDNFNRILTHHQSFILNLDSVTIIEGTKKNIRTIERILLSLYPEIEDNPFLGKDGATEIRHSKDLEQCFNDVNYWSERLNLDIKTPKKEEIKVVSVNDSKRLTNEEKLIIARNKAKLSQLENIINIYKFKTNLNSLVENLPELKVEFNYEDEIYKKFRFKNLKCLDEFIASANYELRKDFQIWVSLVSINGTWGGSQHVGLSGMDGDALSFGLVKLEYFSNNKHGNHLSKDFHKEYCLFHKWFLDLITPYLIN